jgi:hypothetical protein
MKNPLTGCISTYIEMIHFTGTAMCDNPAGEIIVQDICANAETACRKKCADTVRDGPD